MTNTWTTKKTIHYFRTLAVLLAMLAAMLVAMLVASGAVLAATSISSGSAFTIRDNTTSTAYPSFVSFQGLSGTVTDVNLSLNGYTHKSPDDVDVLLVGPQGQKALVMSDVGGTNDVNVNLTLDDEASTSIPDEGQINVTQYKPTQGTSSGVPLGNNPAPQSFPSPAPPGPYATNLSVFDGTDPNGRWNLFVLDDSFGDSGAVTDNWLLQVSTADPIPSDTTAPKVTSVAPKPGATGISPTANVRATFSEDMKSSTVNGSTFKLFRKGSTTQVGATVTYDGAADRNTATLDPTNSLKRGVTYKAVVTTDVTDFVGNRLDQNSTLTGLQQKAWTFTVKP